MLNVFEFLGQSFACLVRRIDAQFPPFCTLQTNAHTGLHHQITHFLAQIFAHLFFTHRFSPKNDLKSGNKTDNLSVHFAHCAPNYPFLGSVIFCAPFLPFCAERQLSKVRLRKSDLRRSFWPTVHL